MARNRTGSYTFSGKACDIEYRSKRLWELTEKARLCLASIDPAAVSPGSIDRGLELIGLLAEVAQQVGQSRPQKRSYVRGGKSSPARAGHRPSVESTVSAVVLGLDLDRGLGGVEVLDAAE